jgi:hypothetical protein
MGFVQSEVVRLMNYLRSNLERAFRQILRNPPDLPGRSLKSTPHPLEPGEDRRVFLLLERVDLSEEFPALHQKGRGDDRAFHKEPKICHGLEDLGSELDRMDQVFRRALVLDLAHTAVGVSDFLAKAPEIKRGRSSLTETEFV